MIIRKDSFGNLKGHLIVYYDRSIPSHRLPGDQLDNDDSDHSLKNNISHTSGNFWYHGKIPEHDQELHVLSVPDNLLSVETQYQSLGDWEEQYWQSSVTSTYSSSSSNSQLIIYQPADEEELTPEEANELAEQNAVANAVNNDDDLQIEDRLQMEVNEAVMNKLGTIVPVSICI